MNTSYFKFRIMSPLPLRERVRVRGFYILRFKVLPLTPALSRKGRGVR
jgi:hypothetical protein